MRVKHKDDQHHVLIVLGAWPILEAKMQHILASAALTLTIFLHVCPDIPPALSNATQNPRRSALITDTADITITG